MGFLFRQVTVRMPVVAYLILCLACAAGIYRQEQLNSKTHKLTVLICDRAYSIAPVVGDLVDGAEAIISQRLEQDIKSGNEKAVNADLLFIRRYQHDQNAIENLLLYPAIKCKEGV